MKKITYKLIELNKPSELAIENLNRKIFEIITSDKLIQATSDNSKTK